MDKLKEFASGSGSGHTGTQQNQGQEDYLDKGEDISLHTRPSLLTLLLANLPIGLDSAEKKFGGGKIDPQKQRGMNEKITDFARDKFEKATG